MHDSEGKLVRIIAAELGLSKSIVLRKLAKYEKNNGFMPNMVIMVTISSKLVGLWIR